MVDELEWQTRKERIDKKLKSLFPAWKIIPYGKELKNTILTNHIVTEYPTQNGPADYSIFVNGKLFGIIEAKKVTVSPLEKRYQKSKLMFISFSNLFKPKHLVVSWFRKAPTTNQQKFCWRR